jgi:HK97 family phage portal protein
VTVAFVVTEGSLQRIARPAAAPSTSVRIADDYTADYAAIWKAQSAVRTNVTFLARNIASLGIHLFERVSDTDRRRLTDHPLAQLLDKPNPRTTRYRLINALVHDKAIYDRAYWLKMSGRALVRIPPAMVTPVGENWLWPEQFKIRGTRGEITRNADEVVYFRGYNPDGDLGCSPIEALRRVLAEDYEAGRMREQVLRNGARMSGYLSRPKDAGKWSDPARERFARGWRAQYSGGGPEAGGTPILEDGMTFTAAAQTAQQLEYVAARKLTREEVAAAYFIPPPMVGLLDHATFGNIEEQHKMLYQDTLGPWLSEIVEDLELQLLGDFPGEARVYVEFNLAEKLRGSFEEQASSIQTLTGAPVMTRNEGRGRLNLPAIDGGDELVVPLNVLVGGQASPTDTAPEPGAAAAPRVRAKAPATHTTKAEQVMRAYFKRQRASVLSALGAKAAGDWWDGKRWDDELAGDLFALALTTSQVVGETVANDLGFDASDYDVDATLAALQSVARSQAATVNETTRELLEAALASDGTPAAVFDEAEEHRAGVAAAALVSTFAEFGSAEAAHQVGVPTL